MPQTIQDLERLGSAIDRPRRLTDELIALGTRLIITIDRDIVLCARPPRPIVPHGVRDETHQQPTQATDQIRTPDGQVAQRTSSEAVMSAFKGPPTRVWAAAIYAAVDTPQWPWLLRATGEELLRARYRNRLTWEGWCAAADRFASWAFGISLPCVVARAAVARGFGQITPSNHRWVAPSIRDLGAAVRTLAHERATRVAEVLP